MTDDAPANGTPDAPDQPGGGPQPDQTVQRPREPDPDLPPPPGATVVATAPDPQPAGQGYGGPPAPPGAGFDAPGPGDPGAAAKAGRTGLTGGLVALGAGLLGAAVVISRARSRSDGDLDWSNFGVGLGATAVLLLIALVGTATAGRREGSRARTDLVTWPGVVGILGVALMLDVGIHSDDEWLGYLIGAVIVVLAAAGYAASRRAAFAVTAIVGLAILYALAFNDLVADNLSDESTSVVVGAAVAVFVVAVTVVGWLLPSRAITGVAVGVAGLAAYAAILLSMLVLRLIGGFFADLPFGSGPMGRAAEVDTSFRESDVWWTIGFVGVLAVGWALAAVVSNHSGFALLALAAPVVIAPLASAVLAVEHPTWWAAILAASGGVLLLGGAAVARRRGQALTRPAYGG